MATIGRLVKTHCKNGYEFTPENTRSRKTGRVCKECQKLRCRKYAKERPELLKALRVSTKQMYRERKAQLVAYKGGSCTDCGGVFPPCCFHFDHRDPKEKIAGIAQLMHRPEEEIKAEADKCDLVCANCHAIRTFNNEAIGEKISLAKRGNFNGI
jgi:hypothetical protein